MCEIAIYEPTEVELENQMRWLADMYQRNYHGLGIISVDTGGETFSYDVYKAETPDWADVYNFVADKQDSWRIFAHARLATSGGKGLAQVHPIGIGCDSCSDIKMVIHNGHANSQKNLEEHTLTTEVDSEVIAHTHQSLPESLDSEPEEELTGSLNYVVFGTDKILGRFTTKYLQSDRFKMGLRNRAYPFDHDGSKIDSSNWFLATPDQSVETTDLTTNYVTYGFNYLNSAGASCSRTTQETGRSSYYRRMAGDSIGDLVTRSPKKAQEWLKNDTDLEFFEFCLRDQLLPHIYLVKRTDSMSYIAFISHDSDKDGQKSWVTSWGDEEVEIYDGQVLSTMTRNPLVSDVTKRSVYGRVEEYERWIRGDEDYKID